MIDIRKSNFGAEGAATVATLATVAPLGASWVARVATVAGGAGLEIALPARGVSTVKCGFGDAGGCYSCYFYCPRRPQTLIGSKNSKSSKGCRSGNRADQAQHERHRVRERVLKIVVVEEVSGLLGRGQRYQQTSRRETLPGVTVNFKAKDSKGKRS